MSSVSEPASATAAQREPILICYDDSPDAVRAIEAEARRIAHRGAEIARSAGLQAEPRGQLASSTWKGIVDVADELDVAVICDRLERPDWHEEGLRREPLAAGRRARRPAGADRAAGALTPPMHAADPQPAERSLTRGAYAA